MKDSAKHDDPLSPTLLVTVKADGAADRDYAFNASFKIGRTEECDVCIKSEFVSRLHASVSIENGEWWLSDRNSSNGIYAGDSRVPRVQLKEGTVVRLGIRGPEVRFRVVRPVVIPRPATDPKMVKSEYAQHYFGKGDQKRAAGEHTMLIRTVFAEVQKKQKRKYGGVILALAGAMVCLGGVTLYQYQQVAKQRAMAKDIFYSMKALDIDIANLRDAVTASNNQQGIDQMKRIEAQRGEMENSYDHYLAGLHVYSPKMSEQDRLVLRVARIFGECELDMPPDFVAEVNKYIKIWQSSGRLERAITRARDNNYTTTISRELLAEGLPPQFFYLALQESDFDPYVSGPATRKGIAKGMWQFIPETAVKYGMHLGPLVDMARPDPLDDRHHYERETVAAAHYLKDLYGSDAQGSGLLVMACYNWGEDYVLPLVRSMPLNPKDRNFWMLLQQHRDKIPKETYDYVFYIVSAAVIGENPRLFGFNFDNPLANLSAQAPANAELRQATGRRSHRPGQHTTGAGLVGVVESRGQRVGHRCARCLEALATMSHTWHAEKPMIRPRVVGGLPAIRKLPLEQHPDSPGGGDAAPVATSPGGRIPYSGSASDVSHLFQLANPLQQELALGLLLGEGQSFLIRGASLSGPGEPAAHIGTG